MTNKIPTKVLDIYKTFQDSGFEVYFVGGCVRNLLLNKEIKDWDVTTNATPEQMQKLFPDSFYDNQFGTVGIPVILGNEETPESLKGPGQSQHDDKKLIVEATTYRTEHGYSDKRRPDKVEWGKTLEEDLSRRDFTINAIALKTNCHPEEVALGDRREDPINLQEIPHSVRNDKTEIIDPFEGKKDLENKLIRAVGNPNERFKEDALRLMRAIRIATQLSFTIEDATWKALVEDAPLIAEIANERVRDELLKILASDYPYEGIMMLKSAGLINYILPELLEGIDISQVRPGRHHTTDVFTHNVMSLKHCTSTDPVVRFATLLHDIGKPRVQATDPEGFVIFHNHEVVGARMARTIADRLRFSKKDRDKIINLIRWHMFTVDEKITDAAVRRFIRRIGVENVKDMMDLRVGDRLGGGTQTAESWRLKLFKQRIEDQLKPLPFSINDLAIDGNDIMKELNMKPGKKVGELLQKLFEEVDEDLSKNTKEYLLQRIKEIN